MSLLCRIALTADAGDSSATQEVDFVVKESSQYGSLDLEILRENDAEISSETVKWPEAVDSLVEAPGASIIQAEPAFKT